MYINIFIYYEFIRSVKQDLQRYYRLRSHREVQYIMVLVLDCMQYITVSMLQHRTSANPPLIMDLQNPEYSPFIVTMQYFSTLLSLDHIRIHLLGYLSGCANAHEFCANTESLTRLRQLLISVDAWVYARLWYVVNSTVYIKKK